METPNTTTRHQTAELNEGHSADDGHTPQEAHSPQDAQPEQHIAAAGDAAAQAGSFWTSPFLWGALATVGFYLAIPYLPAHRPLVERYFCSHPMEYLLTGLFFLAMAILVLKSVTLRGERAALGSGLLDDPELTDATTANRYPLQSPSASDGTTPNRERQQSGLADRVRHLEDKLHQHPALQQTRLGTRIRDVCIHLRGRQSAAGLTEHLKYLAEVAVERLHAGYALVRTITWAIPILGFLGTVIGITLAISNLTPEQLDKSLSAVTGGLGVAFDTTALALALSVVLVFTSFLVERSEQRVLRDVEDFAIQRIAPLFPEGSEAGNPLAEAEIHAAQKLVETTNELIGRQTALWNETLEATRRNWMDTLQAQKSELDASMRTGMENTLSDHAAQLEATRSEFLTAFRAAAETMRDSMSQSVAEQGQLHRQLGETLNGIVGEARTDFQSMTQEHQDRLEQLGAEISERVTQWQERLRQATETGGEQLDELRRQREMLLKLSDQEERLARLQENLTDNLAALRNTENFEETLHSLSAAVHLLTARVRPQAA